MMKRLAILTLLWGIPFISSAQSTTPLLSKKQTVSLFKMMISDIEYYDAEMRESRNSTKEVSWKAYKRFHQKNWKKATSPQELKQLFNAFKRGYLNGHSHLQFLYPIKKTKRVYKEYKSSITLGYNYPEISFYNAENGKKISAINDKPIEEVYWDFANYKTTKLGENAVLHDFSSYFNQRYLRVNGQIPFQLTYEDQQVDSILYREVKPSDEDIFFDAIELTSFDGWEVVEKGYKVALLKKNDVALIKIKNFIYMNGFGDDIACSSTIDQIPDSTMCKDVLLLKQALMSIKEEVNYLFFDLQDNIGGNENTPFIKMFCPAPFNDLRVQYRKTALLEDPKLRDALSYFEPNAENWYTSLNESGIYQELKYGDFLPPRGDFCRGDTTCAIVPIHPNSNLTQDFKKIVILTNHATGSSADDFVFRFKEFGGAYLAGQAHAADLTYALISVLYYLNEKGEIERVFYGNAQEKPTVSGKELFKIDIPYSKTIDKEGNLLQANPQKMDLLVPIHYKNFKDLKRDVLDKAIEFFCE